MNLQERIIDVLKEYYTLTIFEIREKLNQDNDLFKSREEKQKEENVIRTRINRMKSEKIIEETGYFRQNPDTLSTRGFKVFTLTEEFLEKEENNNKFKLDHEILMEMLEPFVENELEVDFSTEEMVERITELLEKKFGEE